MKASKKIQIWIVVAILVAVAAGGLMAWAASPDDQEVVDQAGAEPAGSASGRAAMSGPLPASTPRAVQRNAMDAELIGTAVVEGGTSFALFQSASGTRFVREGDEIVSGVRLVEVRMNRVEIERNGVADEIRVGWSEGNQQQLRRGSNPAGSGVEKRARLIEDLRARGRL